MSGYQLAFFLLYIGLGAVKIFPHRVGALFALIKSGFSNDLSRKNKESYYLFKSNLLAPFGTNAPRGSLHILL